ncbi:hypothetical protein N0V90_012602 [Kalmusia sp. IMI 367209]|nr:hypothetical protein N0V90_012602 [Kalmusia sp. IMI 367209]
MSLNFPLVYAIPAVGFSMGVVILLFKKSRPGATKHAHLEIKKLAMENPGNGDLVAKVVKKRREVALEQAELLCKGLELIASEAEDDYEDLPDSDEERRARKLKRRYSRWAVLARMRKRQVAAARRRSEAMTKEQEDQRKAEAKLGANVA